MKIKTEKEIEAMREGGKILSQIILLAKNFLKPHISTYEVEEFVVEQLGKYGVKSSFLNYKGYPKNSCISVNEEVVHGIPGKRIIENGDIVGIDLGIYYQGLCLDAAITIPIGEVSFEAQKLLIATKDALEIAIKLCKPGVPLGTIGAAIETRIKKDGLSVVENLCGHGIGESPQEPPVVPNYGKEGRGEKLIAGITICIEPMITVGNGKIIVKNDGWTIATRDETLSAQFEKTILITETGSEVLTPF